MNGTLEVWYSGVAETLHSYFNLTYFLIFLMAAMITYWWVFRRDKDKDSPNQILTATHPNRRNRLRRISFPISRKSFSNIFQSVHESNSSPNVTNRRRRMRKRDIILGAINGMLRESDNASHDLRPITPPDVYFDPFIETNFSQNSTISQEVSLLLRNLKIFGNYETPMFIELCKSLERRFFHAGSWIFRPGHKDDSFYVVKSGKISLHVLENSQDTIISQIEDGQAIYSFLSVTAEIIGFLQVYKTMAAKAITDTDLLVLKVSILKDFLLKNPDTFMRVIQVMTLNLIRMNFLALNKYLDVSFQLFMDYKNLAKDAENTFTPRKENLDTRVLSDKSNSKPNVTFILPDECSIENSKTDFYHFIEQATPNISLDQPNIIITNTNSNNNNVNLSYYNNLPSENISLEEEDARTYAEAKTALVKLFQLADPSKLDHMTQLSVMPPGSILFREGEIKNYTYYVHKGDLQTVLKEASGEEVELYKIHAGEIEGTIGLLTGEPSYGSCLAINEVELILIDNSYLLRLLKEEPQVICVLAGCYINRLSPFMRQLDFAIDWTPLEVGETLYKQGEASHSAYIVLSGRLRSFMAKDDKKELIDEFGRGDAVGMISVLTNTPYSTTVYAVRDTQLVRLPLGLLNWIKYKSPQVVSRLIQLLGDKILTPSKKMNPSNKIFTSDLLSALPPNKNVSTVAIMGASNDAPIMQFSEWLLAATSKICHSRLVSSSIVQKALGLNTISHITFDYRLLDWLGRREENSDLLIYQADAEQTTWTRRCLRQADCILIVGVAEKGAPDSSFIKSLSKLTILVQKALVLLHRETTVMPTGTAVWIKEIGYCTAWFHIKAPNSFFSPRHAAVNQQQSETEDEDDVVRPITARSDISRLARWLTGNTIGLVLGGGGARGCAHIGSIKALLEADIPIDMVGGTSIGACIGALYCQAQDYRQLDKATAKFCKLMTSKWDKFLDLTPPFTAMFTGASFNKVIRSTVGDHMIEDLWLPYFCVTTDITDSRMRVHQSGPLWQYVRASMSLSGYLPPMCSPQDGNLLLDGGYVNNLPVDIMKFIGAKTVIAVDVGSKHHTDYTNYGNSVNGWWLMWKKLIPFTGKVKVPALAEIQQILAYVACVQHLEGIVEECEYIRPNIDKYRTLQFDLYTEIASVGYEKCKSMIQIWKKNPILIQSLFAWSLVPLSNHRFVAVNSRRISNNLKKNVKSFRDLASLARPSISQDVCGYWSNPDLLENDSAFTPLLYKSRSLHEVPCYYKQTNNSDSDNNPVSSTYTSVEDIKASYSEPHL